MTLEGLRLAEEFPAPFRGLGEAENVFGLQIVDDSWNEIENAWRVDFFLR